MKTFADMKKCQQPKNRGFTLVVTIMMMALLSVIVIGLLSLSSITLRSSQRDAAHAIARANAKMGLMMAMGQLQRISGQDQRVTATADLSDQASDGRRHWTGVWSTEDWDPREPNDKTFVDWLVSDSQATPNGLLENAVETAPVPNATAVMVGPGSVGSRPDQEVRALKIPVSKTPGKTEGAYAYWVGDQGVKASYAIAERATTDEWSEAAQLALSSRVGIEASNLPELQSYVSLPTEEVARGGTSFLTMDASHGSGVGEQVFHDISPISLSLLTDTRLGGTAKDLSTAFELPHADFHSILEFHGSNERNSTDGYTTLGSAYNDPKFYGIRERSRIGYLTEIRNGSSLFRGPTWDLLRNHYRLYKKEWEPSNSWSRAYQPTSSESFAARGSLPHTYSKTFAGDGATNPFFYHPGVAEFYGRAKSGAQYGQIKTIDRPRMAFDVNTDAGMVHARSPRLMPIISRITIGFGLLQMPVPSAEDWCLGIAFDPYVTLVNPYNVPISFQSIGVFSAKFNPIAGKIRFTDRASGTPKEAPLNQYFSANVYNQGSFAFRIPPPVGQQAWVLQPGEVKVISPVKVGRQDMGRAKINPVRGQFAYSEDAGLYYFYSAANEWQVKPQDGSTVEIDITGSDGAEQDMFTVHLHYAKNHTGGARDVMTHLPPTNMFAEDDSMDDPHITKIGFARGNTGPEGPILIQRSVNTSQIPTEASGPQSIAVIDMKMKSARDDTPLFWLNPRGQAFDTRDYDGGQRTSPLWDSSVRPLGDLSEIQLVGDPSGSGFWGDGHTAANGTNNVVLYEVPQLPLTSLAQFQHADYSLTGSGGSLLIGNSFAHPGLADREAIFGRRSLASGAHTDRTPQALADLAWAGNEMLWDRYFFSGMNWGNTTLPLTGAQQAYATQDAAVDALLDGDPAQKHPLMNPRMVLLDRGYSLSRRDELKDYSKIGEHLAVEGGFNVNSTSEMAWRAVFSTLRDATVQYADNGSARTESAENAFSRFAIPSAAAAGLWEGGFHDLTDEQIEALAEAMVGQVRERGPFIGLADFVNRRLDSGKGSEGTDVGVLGALQAAIEKAGINDRPEVSNPVSSPSMEHKNYQIGDESKSFSTYVGAPHYVMQGDVLSALGSTLRARSDTFVIRSYGESRDASGNISARAWCEATVQRTPRWTQETAEEFTMQSPSYTTSPSGDVVVRPWEENPAFPATNRDYGRRYEMVSFRWLNASEV